jgi:hypothetical protein
MKVSIIYFVIIPLIMQIVEPALFSVSSNFAIGSDRTYDELAFATYEEYSYEKGWNYLHIMANDRWNLLEQHRGAGFLEGYITYRDIYSAYRNLCGSMIKGESLPQKVQNFIDEQLEYIEAMVDGHPRDLYWQYAGGTFGYT